MRTSLTEVRIQNAADSERVATEARKRIDSLRTDGSRRDWKPY